MYNTVLFDLDGTLTDSGEGIINSVVYALDKWGIKVEDREGLKCFIGPPLVDSFEKYYGFSREKSLKTVEYYREYFSVQGLFENRVYKGVEELLNGLNEAGKTLILATSKPEEYTIRILEHFGLDKYFDFVAGATMDEKRSKKSEVIAWVIKNMEIADLSCAVMVGDRDQDILGAKENGIDSIGVLYGYGDYGELKGAGATHIADNTQEVFKIICQ